MAEEPTLQDIKKHLEKQDRQTKRMVYLAGMFWGASLGIAAITLWIGRLASTLFLIVDCAFLAVCGAIFMGLCRHRLKKVGKDGNMAKLTKGLSEFDEDDVKAMDEALGKFAEYKKSFPSGLPDYSPGFVAYTPILSFALLKSQATMEKLTRWIIGLTCFLGVLAILQIVLLIINLM